MGIQHWLLNGLRGWPLQGEGLLRGYDSDTFLDGIIEMPIFQRPQNCWPQWPRRSYEVIWGHFVKNSCLTFFKRSRLHIDWFYGHPALTTYRPQRLAMYKEKVCSVGRTLKHFWMAQLNYLFFSNLKTSDLNGLGGRLRSFEAVSSLFLVSLCSVCSMVWGHYWHSLRTFIMHMHIHYGLQLCITIISCLLSY